MYNQLISKKAKAKHCPHPIIHLVYWIIKPTPKILLETFYFKACRNVHNSKMQNTSSIYCLCCWSDCVIFILFLTRRKHFELIHVYTVVFVKKSIQNIKVNESIFEAPHHTITYCSSSGKGGIYVIYWARRMRHVSYVVYDESNVWEGHPFHVLI